jgi:hypothetical protein
VRSIAGRAFLALLFATGLARADGPVTVRSMCTEMAGWTPQQLAKLKDGELEKFLCVAAKANLRAISTNDKESEKLCTAGARTLMTELKRRHPERDPSNVAGQC